MKNNRKTLFYFSICACLLLLPIITSAYIERTTGGSLIAEVSPSSPKPGEMVEIALSGYGFNIDTSQITWVVNNEIQAEGVGLKNFTFRVGEIGSINSVHTLVESRNNRNLVKNIVFRPAEVSLLMEADTYVPPGYKGARLPSPSSLVKVVAKPNFVINGNKLNSEDLNFQWRRNGTIIESGRGADVLVYNINNDGLEERVEVLVSAPNYGSRATETIIIRPVDPEVLIYENRPLIGTNHNQMIPEKINLVSNVISLKAEPFYFPGHVLNRLIGFRWLLNGNVIQPNTSNPTQITLQRPVEASGSAIIRVDAVNTINSRINSHREIEVFFGSNFSEF